MKTLGILLFVAAVWPKTAGRTEAFNDTLLPEVPGVLRANAKRTSYKMYILLYRVSL